MGLLLLRTLPRKSIIRLAGYCAILILLSIGCHQLAEDRNLIFQSSNAERHVQKKGDSAYKKDPTRVEKVRNGDRIYRIDQRRDWDSGSPIVLEEYKLVFFAIDKNACTWFKMLFRQMMGSPNRKKDPGRRKQWPWSSSRISKTTTTTTTTKNRLKLLYDFKADRATEMMTSPQWTRAIFVRDPKERFVSAYLDKAANPDTHFMRNCCKVTGRCVETARQSLLGFLAVARRCDDAHWRRQSQRIDARFWPFVNFVGHVENLAEDTERLLKKIGAWDQFEKQGWGETLGRAGEYSLARSTMVTFLTPELEKELDEFYADDYANPILGLKKVVIFDPSNDGRNRSH